ncbi:glycosyltransferase [Candidatus Gottesmanbacteria bacterium]|nr:glycosyltransferase [Candidatus Gottesmanbacteria bacterium]
MKIAFVYDRVNKFGGAERVLLALHEIWPEAPLFTPVYNPKTAPYADVFHVKTSVLSRWPLNVVPHEILPPLLPFFYESMTFDDFDLVLTITSAEAKGILTKPGTLHVCYCLTPTRYLWSGYDEYIREPGLGWANGLARFLIRSAAPLLRNWDYISSKRPDKYIAISKAVAERIDVYYQQHAEVIYPPVDTKTFTPDHTLSSGRYFLIVSRLVPYKRIDYAIEVFNNLGFPLKIIGTGIDSKRLRKLAGPTIEFIGSDLTDAKLCWYYQNCQALIYPGEEDFGITAVEAQACGRPVIAYKKGGVAETIQVGKTGELYEEESMECLSEKVLRFNSKEYLSEDCYTHASRFSKRHFQKNIRELIGKYYRDSKAII